MHLAHCDVIQYSENGGLYSYEVELNYIWWSLCCWVWWQVACWTCLAQFQSNRLLCPWLGSKQRKLFCSPCAIHGLYTKLPLSHTHTSVLHVPFFIPLQHNDITGSLWLPLLIVCPWGSPAWQQSPVPLYSSPLNSLLPIIFILVG